MELNAAQKEAVLHDQGPLLIIAGAGTGKTRVITERMLNLINSGKSGGREILALTFTEKAANEMAERIDEKMPFGYEELNIHTFHAFAQQLLREAGLEIGIDPGFKILTQVEQWFFMKKQLFEFELDYYRPLGNPNRFIYSLLSHFGRIKDEMILPEEYLAYAETELEKLKVSLGEGGKDSLRESLLEEAGKLLEIAKAFKKYQELCIANNFMDFGDLCFYANQLLEKRPSVLARYGEKFKYILVDEFQDTNYSQFQLVLKLARQHGNICVVGDDDQSIYKWRGASLSNILQFETYFPQTKKVVLTQNYRSTQNILDSAYSVIQKNNPDRLEVKAGIDKRLQSCKGKGEEVSVHHFKNFIQETAFVAETIKKLKDEEQLSYSDFAILVRANQLSHPFIEELKLSAIPYAVRNPKGLLFLDEIKDLVAVAKVLSNPNDDVALLRVLKMEVFALEMAEILELLNDNKNEYLFQVLKLRSTEQGALPGMESGSAKIFSLLSLIIEESKTANVGQILNSFLDKSGYLKNLIDREKYEELENINEFAKQVGKFERDSNEKSVRDFVEYLNLLEEANGILEIGNYKDKDAVQILTAHGAKGLEFEYVFVINAVNQRFPGSRRSEPFEIPESLTKEIYPEGDFHLQEERRLFYVAMTRAMKKLFITYSDQYEGNKKWKMSTFVAETLKSECAKLTLHEESEDALKKLQEFKTVGKPILDLPKFNRKAKLSYSQFDTFKLCPLKYSYRYMLKIPTAMGHAGNFGISVHSTLNELYRILKRGEMVDLKVLQETYERNWVKGGYESKKHELQRKEQGLKILEKFYEANSNPWVIPRFLEQPFNLKIGDVWINGRIDRIDRLEDGTFEVIDYKTGRLKEGKDPTKDLQLSIYALACRDILKIPVSRLTLYYLEDNEKLSTSRKNEQLDELHGEIIAMVGEMEKSDFVPTPGFHCQFCDFRLICPAV